MQVSVVYAGEMAQSWIDVKIDDASPAIKAIEKSGVLRQYPEINLQQMKIGVYGKFIKPETPLKDGDRVEIYRPILRKLDDEDEDED